MIEVIKKIWDKILQGQIETMINEVIEERVPKFIEDKGVWFKKKIKKCRILFMKNFVVTKSVFLGVNINFCEKTYKENKKLGSFKGKMIGRKAQSNRKFKKSI